MVWNFRMAWNFEFRKFRIYIRILKRVVGVAANGLEYEANPRHVELLENSMNVTAADYVKTPGVKDPVPDYAIAKGDDQPTTATNLGITWLRAATHQRPAEVCVVRS